MDCRILDQRYPPQRMIASFCLTVPEEFAAYPKVQSAQRLKIIINLLAASTLLLIEPQEISKNHIYLPELCPDFKDINEAFNLISRAADKKEIKNTNREEHDLYERFSLSRGTELCFTRYSKSDDLRELFDQNSEIGKSRVKFSELRKKELSMRNLVVLQTKVEDTLVGDLLEIIRCVTFEFVSYGMPSLQKPTTGMSVVETGLETRTMQRDIDEVRFHEDLYAGSRDTMVRNQASGQISLFDYIDRKTTGVEPEDPTRAPRETIKPSLTLPFVGFEPIQRYTRAFDESIELEVSEIHENKMASHDVSSIKINSITPRKSYEGRSYVVSQPPPEFTIIQPAEAPPGTSGDGSRVKKQSGQTFRDDEEPQTKENQDKNMFLEIINKNLNKENDRAGSTSVGSSSAVSSFRAVKTFETAINEVYHPRYLLIAKMVFILYCLCIYASQTVLYTSVDSLLQQIRDNYDSFIMSINRLEAIVIIPRRVRNAYLLQKNLTTNDRLSRWGIPNYDAYCKSPLITQANTTLVATFALNQKAASSGNSEFARHFIYQSVQITRMGEDGQLDPTESSNLLPAILEMASACSRVAKTPIGLLDDLNPDVYYLTHNNLNGLIEGTESSGDMFMEQITSEKRDGLQKVLLASLGIIAFNISILLTIVWILFRKLTREKINFLESFLKIPEDDVEDVIDRYKYYTNVVVEKMVKERKLYSLDFEEKKKFQERAKIETKMMKNQNIKRYKSRGMDTRGTSRFYLTKFVQLFFLVCILVACTFQFYSQTSNFITSNNSLTSIIFAINMKKINTRMLRLAAVEYLASDGRSSIRFLPIGKRIEIELEEMSQTFSASESLYTSGDYENILNVFETRDLCEIIYLNNPKENMKWCRTINKGVMTQGLNKLNTFIWQVSADQYLEYIRSNRTIESAADLMNSAVAVDVEYMIDRYLGVVYNYLNRELVNYYYAGIDDQSSFNLTMLATICILVSVAGGLLYFMIFVKAAHEFVSLKRFMRMIPLDIIMKNKMIRKFLANVSPQTLITNKLQSPSTC
eukprot:TRINITY_DN2679_c0_g1_i5.p1 TRINITY_DN2679_c0_g1~~TRINITY_DN2679_c0_g1_i5.p1  ORF type:complete len:1036 (-),score=116.14 TRINITY_DN2679_c0_g1_i5:1986-5093(-)